MVRVNLSLVIIGVLANLAYGFSRSPNLVIGSAFSHNFNQSNRLFLSRSNLNDRPFRTTQSDGDNNQSIHARDSSLESASGLSEVPDPFNVVRNFPSRGGAIGAINKVSKFVVSFWASSGVVYILMKAIKRVLPIALEPLKGDVAVPLNGFQLAAYISTCLFFAYAEGYKGFQKKFSPLVVTRSFTIQPSLSTLHHIIFAPFYAMGLFHATKKRKIVSWSVSIGVAGIVAGVKRLSYPWRNIVDAGVVVGLSWGAMSILVSYVKALFNNGVIDGVDPALPGKN